MTMRKRADRQARRWLAAGLAACLTGCSFAPVYKAPAVELAPAWKESSGLWQPARPADGVARGEWWKPFGSATLDRLESELNQQNPNLAVALARYDAARAYVGEARSGLFPQIGLGASPTRNRQSDQRPLRGSTQPSDYSSNTAQFSIDYEFDFWGRVRNQVAAGRATADAAGGDLQSARLSLQAELADTYLRLSGLDTQSKILDDTITAYRQALGLTQRRFAGGIDSALSVSRAKTQLSDALAQAAEVTSQRALAEHAIASLVGRSASTFSLPPQLSPVALPAIPLGLPSTLLQRRPDIAAAERRTFAANAEIGVARAAFYPSFSLSGLFGWQNTGSGSLLTAGNEMWAVGPVAALSLFDGGLRRAHDAEAKAGFEAASGAYRATVLTAFQQVEDNLSLLDNLSREAGHEDDAATSAKASEDIATHRYEEGAVSYLDVVTAQTSYLQARRSAEQLRTRRLQASVDLIRALGGAWDKAA